MTPAYRGSVIYSRVLSSLGRFSSSPGGGSNAAHLNLDLPHFKRSVDTWGRRPQPWKVQIRHNYTPEKGEQFPLVVQLFGALLHLEPQPSRYSQAWVKITTVFALTAASQAPCLGVARRVGILFSRDPQNQSNPK
ncbi:unnamed protein product [Gulo gulo]|uniref:Uncharacterized protein n=1 Tax=Gulo gulo TaxID=48420 RepID=A0A9X9MB68_GULGU|nr:unnamed protein product [Gulo gulo]